jgi:ATP-dependent helicase HrpA
MSAELVETSRLFARVNAAIDPAWAEAIAGDLAKRSYSEPRWEKKQGAVIANERVTLFGLPIIPKRSVQFSRIDMGYARDLFIRNALVDGDWDLSRVDKRITAFDRDNRALRTELEELEERTRRRSILFDDETVYRFYDARIPADVASLVTFEKWWRTARVETPDLLTMTREALIEEEDVPVADEDQFPSVWRQGEQTLALTYRFEPGTSDDGVTVHVPVALLAGLSSSGFDWQVPGLREELVTALIKSLPKVLRREVVPAGDWARKLLAALPSTEGSLVDALAREIRAQTNALVQPSDFDLERVPDHLRPTFAVIGERGKVLARGKSLSALQLQLKAPARESVARATSTPKSDLERDGLTGWDFDELPRTLDTKHAGGVVRAWPALVDAGKSVSIQLMSTEADQLRSQRGGVRRMLQLAIPAPTAYVQEHLTTAEKLALAASPYRSNAELFDDCLAACIDAVVDTSTIFTRAEFEAAREAVNAGIVDAMFDAVSDVSRVLAAAREADRAISAASNVALLAPLADAREQLGSLVHAGFVGRTGLAQLRRVPVYLQGIVHRVSKLAENLGRDRTWLAEVQEATERYISAGGDLPLQPDAPPHLRHARWMIEELRLSLFAQHLPTAEPVSLQRITKVLAGG